MQKDREMNRFIVLDEFGDALRTFYLKSDAKIFMRNKKGCKLHEISLYDSVKDIGNCLI